MGWLRRPINRRQVGVVLAAAVVTVGAVAVGGTGASAAAAPVDRGTIVEVPRNGPFYLELSRTFPVGTVFSVSVYENMSTGYRWTSSLPAGSESVVRFLDTDYVSDLAPSGMAGVGGTRYFRYQAVGRGSVTVTLRYQRPWESTPPLQQVTLGVVVC